MKLLLVFNNYRSYYGGGDYSIYKFFEHLVKLGHEVILYGINKSKFINSADTQSKKAEEMVAKKAGGMVTKKVAKKAGKGESEQMSVFYRGEIPHLMKGFGFLDRTYENLYDFFHLKRLAKGCDAVVGYQRVSAIKASKIGADYGLPVVNFVFETPDWMREHLSVENLDFENDSRLKSEWARFKTSLLDSQVVISNSKLSSKKVEAWLGRKISGFVYPGIEVNECLKKQSSVEPQQKPQQKLSTQTSNQIIFVGRLIKNKNVDLIVKAMSRLKYNGKLVIVGSGPERSNLEKLSAELGVKTEFKNRVSDSEKWTLLKNSKFMVFPTSFEGFGMPPMEALLCGRPCVCSDLPILKEVYGNNVDFFRAGNLDSLVKTMDKLLSDESYRARRGKSGKSFILKNFSWAKSAVILESILLTQLNKAHK